MLKDFNNFKENQAQNSSLWYNLQQFLHLKLFNAKYENCWDKNCNVLYTFGMNINPTDVRKGEYNNYWIAE